MKEAEEAEHVALFRSMPSCFAALVGMALARGETRGRDADARADAGENNVNRQAG